MARLISLNGALPYDIGTEKEILAKRRKIAEAMLGASLEKSSPVIDTGLFKVANWGDAIGKVANAWGGKKLADETDQRDREVAADSNQRLEAGISDYLKNRMGQQGVPVGQDTRALDASGAEGAPPTAIGNIAPNPIKAIAQAMGSNLGPLQTLAAQDFQGLLKARDPAGGLTAKDWLTHGEHFSPEALAAFNASVAAGNPDPGLLKGRPKAQVAGDMAVSTQDGNVMGTKPIATYSPPKVDPSTGIPMQTKDQTGQAHGLAGGLTSQPAARRENMASEADLKRVEKTQQDALDSVNGLRAVARAQTIAGSLDERALGITSNARLILNKAIQAAGGAPLKEGSSVEELKGALGDVLISKIRALAPVTQEDIAEMKSILGSNQNTKAGLQGMLDFLASKYANSIETHNRFVESLAQEPGIGKDWGDRWRVDFTARGNRGFGTGESTPQRIRFDAQGNQIQ